MKRIFAAVLILAALLPTALAYDIEGGGWWDDCYEGSYWSVPGTGLEFKLPDSWTVYQPDDDFPVFYNASESMFLMADYRSDTTVREIEQEIEESGMESMHVTLGQDRDWFIFHGLAGEFIATCAGERGGVLYMTFGIDDLYGMYLDSFDEARRIVSSVRS